MHLCMYVHMHVHMYVLYTYLFEGKLSGGCRTKFFHSILDRILGISK